jgi:hypothetical protein
MRTKDMGRVPPRTTVNFWIDVLIAVAFVAAAVSGVVLLAMGPAGYRGGRGAVGAREVLFLGRAAWRDLHNWSGIAMAAGVLGHLVLHARWIGCVIRNLVRNPFRNAAARRMAVKDCPTGA